MHILVAGAGITGLAGAWRLARAGAEVTVVDPSDRIGGMLRTSLFAGRAVDEGADAFLVRTPAALALARAVGLGDVMAHPARRNAHIWHAGSLHRLPSQVMGVPIDLDAVEESGLLSPEGLARLRCDLVDPPSVMPPGDVTIAEAVGSRIGAEALALLVDPLLGGINAGHTADQSLAAVAPQLDAARRDPSHASLIEACRAQVGAARAAGIVPDAPIFAAPAGGGMARLVSAVAAAAEATGRVTLHLGAGLKVVEPGGEVVLSDGSTVSADGVLIATPAPAAAEALAALAPDVASPLRALDHVSVAMVRLALPAEEVGRALDGAGMLVPRTEGLAVTACSWASSKWAHLAPRHGDGTVIVRAAVGRDRDQAALDLDDDALVARVIDDLTDPLQLAGGPTEVSVHRWADAFPQFRPGHLDRVTASEDALAQLTPPVAIAGMYLRGVGIPASVTSANTAADRLLAAVAAVRPPPLA